MTEPTDPNASPKKAASDTPGSDTSFRLTEFILIVLTYLLLIATVILFNSKNLILWSLLSVASLPLLIILTPLRKWKRLNVAYTVLFSCLFIGLFIYRVAHHTKTQPAQNLSSPTNGLNFIDPSETVPWCTTLTGDGIIPTGDSLLIFDSPAEDLSGKLISPARYGFQGTATQTSSNNWSINNVHIRQKGDEGQYDKLFGVLLNDETAAFIQSIIASVNNPQPGQGPYWRSGTLPHGSDKLGRFSCKEKPTWAHVGEERIASGVASCRLPLWSGLVVRVGGQLAARLPGGATP